MARRQIATLFYAGSTPVCSSNLWLLINRCRVIIEIAPFANEGAQNMKKYIPIMLLALFLSVGLSACDSKPYAPPVNTDKSDKPSD